ncbi:MAG: hypothetical protein ABFD96_16370 [Armatimonadia bacterium]
MAGGATAATLEQLSFDEMVEKSTSIVHGRVIGTYTTAKGSLIYTHYRVQVSERWKGAPALEADLVVPGGVLGNVRQSFTGAPRLAQGSDYVLFLWTGKSGLTHIIGLTQGLFDVTTDAKGNTMAVRGTSGETMLDRATGKPVTEESLSFTLTDLRTRILRATGGAK